MPTRANPGRKSPLELLTKKPVSVVDVVVFSSPCKVYQNPLNASLGKRGAPGIIVEKTKKLRGARHTDSREVVRGDYSTRVPNRDPDS
uniref:Uncharacterized protein n=1 Tax=Peronospora matthiolae TaxID=2874970 RepID=A0AAV1TTY6_9STRA